MPIPTLVIAGTHSGVGKTSVAIGLMRAFAARGLQVQSFKVGPDFIDPSHHWRATGRVSHNLDGWMLNREQNLGLFNQACQGADLAIVEGVMGLFDGYGAESEAGSTAEMAKWLGAPVILVINACALGRSAAALISGYNHFDPDLMVAGVICNQIGSESHLKRICLAVSQTVQVPILGGIPRTKSVKIPQRHLGLWRANEAGLTDYLDTLAQLVTDHLDLEELIKIAQSGQEQSTASINLAVKTDGSKRLPRSPKVRIGIAQDQAFCFYYAINLSLLEQAGAELIPFSPIQDLLPDGLDGLYIGGGYPELHAEQLSENRELCDAIATFCTSGRPVYTECGGLMYLSQGLLGAEKQRYHFVGILPFWTQMGKRVKLGYRQVEMVGAYNGFPRQGKIRGHRFHYSDIVDAQGNLLDITPTSLKPSQKDKLQFNYRLQGWNHHQTWEGYQIHTVLASYVHLHFGSNPTFAQQFVQFCRQ
ncbi:MAG: cobyrinate a,c-diamide synthase [Cyanobacteria bacterium P01_H01_bin.21]